MFAQYFVKVNSFLDFARYACAFREFPLRVYSFDYKGKKILSSRKILSNSILHFYTDSIKEGRYISYDPRGGEETAEVVMDTKKIATYAPIVHLVKMPFPISKTKKIRDKFRPIRVKNLGNLARLTYNPEWPDDLELTLLAFPFQEKWMIGYTTRLDLEDTVYCFNYVELEREPDRAFIKYSGHQGASAEFTNKFQHGFPYLPVVKLKDYHPIFGMN